MGYVVRMAPVRARRVFSGALPDNGAAEIDGQRCQFRSALDALNGGVAVIYQELNLVPEMSVAENVWLGHFSTKGPFVDFKELERKTRQSLSRVGLDVDSFTYCWVPSASPKPKQMVEIAKASDPGRKGDRPSMSPQAA